jgi:serine acetyltransferase
MNRRPVVMVDNETIVRQVDVERDNEIGRHVSIKQKYCLFFIVVYFSAVIGNDCYLSIDQGQVDSKRENALLLSIEQS